MRTRTLVLALLAMFTMASSAHAQMQVRPPAVRVVFMTADWCPNCAALRPELDMAISRVEDAVRIDMDVTTPARRAKSRDAAIANNILAQHDAWIGRTGFAAVVDASTHRTLGCVTATWKAPEIEGALRRAVAKARSRANRPLRLSDCPA